MAGNDEKESGGNGKGVKRWGDGGGGGGDVERTDKNESRWQALLFTILFLFPLVRTSMEVLVWQLEGLGTGRFIAATLGSYAFRCPTKVCVAEV